MVQATRKCAVEGCNNPVKIKSRGWCGKHYSRWLRNGTTDSKRPVYRNPEEAFQASTEWDGGCLLWTKYITPSGYARIRVGHRKVPAHRYAWERVNGVVPHGMEVDHTCHNRACVNVDHLRIATREQNARNQSGASKDNSHSGIRNVYPDKGKWKVSIKTGGKSHYFGRYDTTEEAARVAEQYRQKLFGEFAGKG